MTVTVDATLAGANSNSYITVATATAYFDNRLDSGDWTAASADTKAAAVITATTWLEGLEYSGNRATTTQALKWPRTDITCDGIEADETFIPTEIKNATAEVALALIGNPDLMRKSSGGPGAYDRVELGDLKVQYRTDMSINNIDRITDVLPWLRSFLGCWAASVGNQGQVRLYRN
jgi:hypothetical protein